ncbi:MAG TPA: DUF4158 domain-containing protein, partial [Candidatus Bathyarchaeia archaeon]|nr:DUF4158 domain-containing protein [Candidatus Bathyarchaeia archaeon]
YLTPEQRYALMPIPADLSDREIARYYTFTQKDLDLIHHLVEQQHATIYREHPFLAAPDFSARLRQLINTPVFRQILLLDS